MGAWLLLVLTFGSAWITYDAFRFGASMDEPRHRYLPSFLKHGMEHLTLAEQDELQRRSRFYTGLFGLGVLPWLFLVMTLLFAVAAGREFEV